MWTDAEGLTFYRNTPPSFFSIAFVEGLKLEADLDPLAEFDKLSRTLRVVGEQAPALHERTTQGVGLGPVAELYRVRPGLRLEVIGEKEVDTVAGAQLLDRRRGRDNGHRGDQAADFGHRGCGFVDGDRDVAGNGKKCVAFSSIYSTGTDSKKSKQNQQQRDDECTHRDYLFR